MRFYRQLATIAVITFDLDDTLYDNRPVIDKTEQELLNFIRCYDDRFSQLQFADLQTYQTSIANQYPEIYHDVTQRRWLAVKALLCHYGDDAEGSTRGADNIMAHFTYWRNQIENPSINPYNLSYISRKSPVSSYY